MKKIFLLFALVFSLNFGNAGQINKESALSLAKDFISNRNNKDVSVKSLNLELKKYNDEIFIINNQTGGWLILSSKDNVPQIVLAYSPKGSLDIEKLPSGIEEIIRGYSSGIRQINQATDKMIKITRSVNSVAPLLGDIAWDQGAPYNTGFPEIEIDNEIYTALTGCVNNAEGELMYYHRYPAQGRGSYSYQWNGQTLSADFSKSIYRWDLMLPSYNGSENEESIKAVSTLLYDLAISNEANFGIVTGGILYGKPMVDFFDYDPGIIMVYQNRCTREYYEEVIREDLDAGLPVYIQGYNEYGGGHAFLCDGYDEEGYFHYNMGGESGGYFLSTATGYDRNQMVLCHIQPDKGHSPGLWAGSEQQFYWDGSGDILYCNSRGDITSNVYSDMEVALALENINSGEKQYFVKGKYKLTSFFVTDQLNFNDKVEDGEYILYPVCRIEGEEWQIIHFPDYAADHVAVNVKNGVKTYTNVIQEGPIEEGVVLIDGIYYNLNEYEQIATVTYRNNLYNSYSGDVLIPPYVEYNGEKYFVSAIGENAFNSSNINTLTIGENVASIGFRAFREATVGKIIYVEERNVTYLDEQVFFKCYIDDLVLPNGLTSLPRLTEGGWSKRLYIPSSINYMAVHSVILEDDNLKDVYVYWTTENDLPAYGFDEQNNYGPLFGNFKNVTLHVPVGTIDMYKNDNIWGVFGTITDDEAGVDSLSEDNDEIFFEVKDGYLTFTFIPNNDSVSVYDMNGHIIAKCRSGELISLPHGIYVLRYRNTIRKVFL